MIEDLACTPDRLATLVGRARRSRLTAKPAPDRFSIRENVHHLRDIEVEGFDLRLSRICSENHPVLPGIDGERLAKERRYNETPHDAPLAEFGRVRARNIAALRGLAPGDWARMGTLEGAGAITIERLVDLWLEHDRDHLLQIEAILDAHAL